jgi:hypothetical protein
MALSLVVIITPGLPLNEECPNIFDCREAPSGGGLNHGCVEKPAVGKIAVERNWKRMAEFRFDKPGKLSFELYKIQSPAFLS